MNPADSLAVLRELAERIVPQPELARSDEQILAESLAEHRGEERKHDLARMSDHEARARGL